MEEIMQLKAQSFDWVMKIQDLQIGIQEMQQQIGQYQKMINGNLQKIEALEDAHNTATKQQSIQQEQDSAAD